MKIRASLDANSQPNDYTPSDYHTESNRQKKEEKIFEEQNFLALLYQAEVENNLILLEKIQLSLKLLDELDDELKQRMFSEERRLFEAQMAKFVTDENHLRQVLQQQLLDSLRQRLEHLKDFLNNTIEFLSKRIVELEHQVTLLRVEYHNAADELLATVHGTINSLPLETSTKEKLKEYIQPEFERLKLKEISSAEFMEHVAHSYRAVPAMAQDQNLSNSVDKKSVIAQLANLPQTVSSQIARVEDAALNLAKLETLLLSKKDLLNSFKSTLQNISNAEKSSHQNPTQNTLTTIQTEISKAKTEVTSIAEEVKTSVQKMSASEALKARIAAKKAAASAPTAAPATEAENTQDPTPTIRLTKS